MAIAIDATSSGTTGTSTLTVSHTNGAAGNILVVSTNVLKLTPLPTYSGVTYNGASLTKVDEILNNTALHRVALWTSTADISTGANNIVVTVSATPIWLRLAAASYSGADNTGYGNTAKTEATAGSTLSVSVTVSNSTDWIVGAADASSANITSLATGDTTSFERASATNDEPSHLDTNGTVGSTGSKSFGFTESGSGNWKHLIVATLEEPAAAPVASNARSRNIWW